eukprot:jgi/Chlat1/6892/Chrsp52S06576
MAQRGGRMASHQDEQEQQKQDVGDAKQPGGEEILHTPVGQLKVLERGHVFFFYKPKVQQENPRSVDDIQRLYIILRPMPVEAKEGEVAKSADDAREKVSDVKEAQHDAGEQPEPDAKKQKTDKADTSDATEVIEKSDKAVLRVIAIGKKVLPEPGRRERLWGFVELVTTKADTVKEHLSGKEYDTATRGHRHQPAARGAGEGIYRIVRHQKKGRCDTHFVYALEVPKEPGDVQRELRIQKEGSFVMLVKNPTAQTAPSWSRPAVLDPAQQPKFPKHLLDVIGDRRFIPLEPVEFLNYEGCELVFIGASHDVSSELGMELKPDDEDPEHRESLDLIQTLQLLEDDRGLPMQPLMEGEWK